MQSKVLTYLGGSEITHEGRRTVQDAGVGSRLRYMTYRYWHDVETRARGHVSEEPWLLCWREVAVNLVLAGNAAVAVAVRDHKPALRNGGVHHGLGEGARFISRNLVTRRAIIVGAGCKVGLCGGK